MDAMRAIANTACTSPSIDSAFDDAVACVQGRIRGVAQSEARLLRDLGGAWSGTQLEHPAHYMTVIDTS